MIKGTATPNTRSKYGSQLIPASTNLPGARTLCGSWRDLSGSLWLFGGYGYASGPYEGTLNDLWKFDINTNNWTWMRGDTVIDAFAKYGVQGVQSALNEPGARQGAVSWIDSAGSLLLFGGYGSSTPDQYTGKLNDIWRFTPALNQWTWIKGDSLVDAYGVYGTKGVASLTNAPGGRESGVAWTDRSSILWLFGGNGFSGVLGSTDNVLNDLWKLSNVFIFNGNGNWSDNSNWLNNVSAPTNVPAATEVYIDPAGICNQPSNLSTQPAGKIIMMPAKTLNLNGNLDNAGTITGNGVVNLAVGNSQLASTGTFNSTLQLTGKKIVLNSDFSGGGVILTNKSSIQLGNFNLRMDTFLLSGNDSNFIITNGTGSVVRKVGSSAVTFPVGTDSSSYSPVTITSGGSSGNINVRAVAGVSTTSRVASPVFSGHVNRTWIIKDSINRNSTITFQWNAADEQPGFDRTNCYVSQSHACQPPPNCTDIYYDVTPRIAASGTGPFTMTRNNVTTPTSFIIKSSPDTSTFTGNGTWDDPNNWTVGIVPSKTIGMGRVVIINPPVGSDCIVTGDIIIQHGGVLRVKSGYNLKINGKIIVE